MWIQRSFVNQLHIYIYIYTHRLTERDVCKRHNKENPIYIYIYLYISKPGQ